MTWAATSSPPASTPMRHRRPSPAPQPSPQHRRSLRSARLARPSAGYHPRYLLETIQIAGGGSALDSLVKRSLLDGMRDSLTARGHELEPFLRCFVPALVEERLDAGQSGAALHEHRKLISVFMKVLGLALPRLAW